MTPAEQDMMACFRSDYLEMLDGRLGRIRRLVDSQEFEAVHVALLSLESSSAMLGADGLVGAVKRLRAALDHEPLEEVERLTGEVLAQADLVRGQLGEQQD